MCAFTSSKPSTRVKSNVEDHFAGVKNASCHSLPTCSPATSPRRTTRGSIDRRAPRNSTVWWRPIRRLGGSIMIDRFGSDETTGRFICDLLFLRATIPERVIREPSNGD